MNEIQARAHFNKGYSQGFFNGQREGKLCGCVTGLLLGALLMWIILAMTGCEFEPDDFSYVDLFGEEETD